MKCWENGIPLEFLPDEWSGEVVKSAEQKSEMMEQNQVSINGTVITLTNDRHNERKVK